MIRIISTILTCSVTLLGMGQQDAAVSVIPGKFSKFTIDELGNMYLLRGDELELYRPDGDLWMRNSVKTLGAITVIDAFYSLKPMLFSAGMQQMAVLDNTLSVQGSVIGLARNGWPQVTMAAASVQNNFWFFDQRELAITRVTDQLRTISTTGRLDQLLGVVPAPLQMIEFDSWLYVNDPQLGILVFDLFATYYKTIPITGADEIQVQQDQIIFTKKGEAFAYNVRSFEITPMEFTGLQVRAVRTGTGRIYVLTDKGLHIFSKK